MGSILATFKVFAQHESKNASYWRKLAEIESENHIHCSSTRKCLFPAYVRHLSLYNSPIIFLTWWFSNIGV